MNPGDLFCVCILLAVSGAVAVYILDYVAGVEDLRKRCREAEEYRDDLSKSHRLLQSQYSSLGQRADDLTMRLRNRDEYVEHLHLERNSRLDEVEKWVTSAPKFIVDMLPVDDDDFEDDDDDEFEDDDV